jgi:putative aldouronate transport system substrate-binding protein
MSEKKMTRRAFLAVIGVSGAAAILASCAPKPTPTPPPTAAPKAEPTKPQATAAPAKAAPVELIYFFGGAAQKDVASVEEAMSAYMKERINATIKLNAIEWASYTEKMKLKDAAGEKYDLCFTSSWANPYYDAVRNGVYADLTEALPKWAPKYYANLNPAVWNAPKVKGRLYAAVNQQIFPCACGPCAIPKVYADKYQLDLSKVNTIEDMEPWMERLLVGEGGKVIPYWSGYNPWWGGIWYFDTPGYGVTVYNDKEMKVLDLWEFDGWRKCMALIKKWYQKGYMIKELMPTGERDAAVKAMKFGWLVHRAKPGGAAERKRNYGWDVVEKITENPTFLTTGNITSTMTAVNKNTSSLEACVRYLELVNTDKYFYNLLCFGIEGKHWVWKDKAKEVVDFPSGVTAQTATYNPGTDWEFGDVFNSYYRDETQVGAWDETRKINNASVPSTILGFALDREPIKNELAAIDAAAKEFNDMYYGIMDYEKVLDDFIAKIKAAGAEKVKAEVQKQLLEWKATAG